MTRFNLLAVLMLLWSCGEPIDPAQREWLPDQDALPGQVVNSGGGADTIFNVVFYNVENLFDTKDVPAPGTTTSHRTVSCSGPRNVTTANSINWPRRSVWQEKNYL